MNKCLFCGTILDDVTHYQGSESQVCKSTLDNRVNCRGDWQNFKIRLEKYKKSPFQNVKEFAFVVENKVIIDNDPAINWNRQLMSVRKLQKKMPMIKVIQ